MWRFEKSRVELARFPPLTYDSFGRVTGVKVDNDTTPRCIYYYGNLGEVCQAEDTQLGEVVKSGYDLSNRPRKVIWRSGQHHYTGEVEDTLVNGTVYMITGKVAEEKVPVTGKMRFNTKFKNWKRTKFGKQTILQTALQGYYNHQYSSAKYMLSNYV